MRILSELLHSILWSYRVFLALAVSFAVFFDMEVGGQEAGRIEFELRADGKISVKQNVSLVGRQDL